MLYTLYVSVAGDQKIAVYGMDAKSGALFPIEEVPTGGSVMSLVVNRAQNRLYASIRSIPELQTYARDTQTGYLSLLGRTPLKTDACYLFLDRTDRYLLSAYYKGGGVAVHAIGSDDVVLETPVEWRTTSPCAHSIQTDPTNRFAFVPHVAESNCLLQFRFDETTGHLAPNDPATVNPAPDTGPRHYCHHRTKDIVYVVNEQANTITAYRFDPEQGTLTPFQTISTLPPDYSDHSMCAEIHLHPSGRFLYASNRGHDSIACFAVQPEQGTLSAVGQVPTEETPRAFNIDPDGHFLFAGGQATKRLASYRIDQKTGWLAPLAVYEVGHSPSWVMALRDQG